jgi:hypothetical protein
MPPAWSRWPPPHERTRSSTRPGSARLELTAEDLLACTRLVIGSVPFPWLVLSFKPSGAASWRRGRHDE